jgi:acetyl-CoA carboxylase biotin carboxyl carrier protein
MMNLEDIQRLLDLVREHDLSELEVEQDGVRVRLVKRPAVPAYALPPMVAAPVMAATPTTVASEDPVGGAPAEPSEGVDLAVVKSPIVGTFYRASDPNAAPFAEVGQAVKKRQVLCIIEAMKLMNEIESEYEGEVVKVYVENGQPVQYGERLFAIKVT